MRTVDRILAVSDIHAENEKFIKLLTQTEYDPVRDLLVICGDMIDRGTENLDTLATSLKLHKQGAILLKGNHEQFLQQSLIEMLETDTWRTKPSEGLFNWVRYNGGATMYEEIKDLSTGKLSEILKFTQGLLLYSTIGNYIFTHAGANVVKTIEENTENELVWMEDTFLHCPAYWGKVVIFGHEPTWNLYPYNKKAKRANARIWYDTQYKDKIGIDCGSIFGGRMAALELPSYREFYV